MFMTPARAVPPTQSLGDLFTAELFVVSSLRLWMLSHRNARVGYPDWHQGFLSAGICSVGAVAFDTVCRIVSTTVLRRLDIRSLCCARLGEDEAAFLRIIGMLQRDRVRDAEWVFSGWCPASAARLAVTPARAFASVLGCRGLWVLRPFEGLQPPCRLM